MLFTPILALAGLAAAAPQGLVHRRTTNDTVPAYKVSRSALNGNYTAPAGVKLVSRSAHNFNGTFPSGLTVTHSA